MTESERAIIDAALLRYKLELEREEHLMLRPNSQTEREKWEKWRDESSTIGRTINHADYALHKAAKVLYEQQQEAKK